VSDDRRFAHRIDADDRIVHVNDEWVEFAIENDAPHLDRGNVLGRKLWSYVNEPTTRHLYQVLVRRVRDSGETATVPYRCDAPDRRRELRMEISLREDGEVEFASRIVSAEPREPVAVLDFRAPRGGGHVRMCSWCKAVKTPEGWVDTESAVARLGLLQGPTLPPLTHGICDDCREKLAIDPSLFHDA